ncbi:pyridoxamine 5'-phosphate oxidase [[Candida] railenensis]|uniref:pyridoxal 5'-phosphate synthase n=1 Tax=[Candida] railenensis TaxID=45579 RepID=A0A9P0QP31_9ASCO|nr:pyridoxamine 5'-phosphate oxidase [[Candida] railenensis]
MSTEKPIIFAPETYQYTKSSLNEKDLASSPIAQFHTWFDEARKALPKDSDIIPEATTFSTARLPSGRVSSRVVLFKELDTHGFIVYSNWDQSKKAKDYESNKFASLTFFWPHIQRQVRVEGIMEKVNIETSARYFATRPRGSKIGAWSSPQSQVIDSREDLNEIYEKNETKFANVDDAEIPCPEYWGGVRIVPLEVEFWQGGMSRLHDRLCFRRENIEDDWNVVRIAP